MSLRKIIAYNVDFGDCILLIFQENGNRSMLLVDFGTRMKAKNQVKWKKVAKKIKEEIQANNVSKLHFLLTHYHEDHYNGLKELDGVIDIVYTGIDLLKYTKKYTLKEILGIEANQETVEKGKLRLKGTEEEINILWPNKKITSDCFKKLS